jgi:hypothetical protein
MCTTTHPETTLQRPGQDALITPEARQRRLSIAVASEIILTIGFVLLKAFKFVHSRRSSGSEW